MGIFDFFKSRRSVGSPNKNDSLTNDRISEESDTAGRSSDRPQGEKPDKHVSEVGNLEHTAIIQSLLQSNKEDRGDEWVIKFLSHVGTASFACGNPQVIQGPDNFPYFQIFLPPSGVNFQSYVIQNMIDDFLLENGFGIALEPKGGDVEWVLTYGDLMHYSVHKTFAYPINHGFVKSSLENEVLDTNEKVLVGVPSESILPLRSRQVIKSFLQAQGVSDPKVCLINRQELEKGQHLVFNIVPWQFESENHFHSIMKALGWFLPGYYSYIGVKEDVFGDGFLPL